MKLREIWQTGNKCLTLVEARFLGKSIRPLIFRNGVRHKFAKIEKPAFTNPTFFV